MIYGPGFLAVVWFGSSPTPSPLASCLSFPVFLFVAGRAYLRGGGGGAKSYAGEKAWSSIHHSTLSGYKSGPGRKCATDICSKHKQRSLSHLPSSGCYSGYSTASMWYSGMILMSARLWMTCSCITSFACLLLQFFSGCRGCRVEYVRVYEWHNIVFQRAAVYWNRLLCVTAIPNTATTPVTVPSSILINNGTANAT